MYPETDIPSFILSNQEWLTILENLPMSDDERNMRMQQFEISQDQSKQIIARQLDDIFVDNIGDLPHKGLATLLLENDTVNPQLLANVLRAKEAGHLSRESMNEIVTTLIGSNPTVEEIAEYAEKNGYKPANVADLASVVDSIIAQRIDFVKERGMGAMGPLMGIVMQESAGADGKQVSALLRVAIQKAIE
jgi:glutamyl-tRNA(Gln) amidotransferase subunit E